MCVEILAIVQNAMRRYYTCKMRILHLQFARVEYYTTTRRVVCASRRCSSRRYARVIIAMTSSRNATLNSCVKRASRTMLFSSRCVIALSRARIARSSLRRNASRKRRRAIFSLMCNSRDNCAIVKRSFDVARAYMRRALSMSCVVSCCVASSLLCCVVFMLSSFRRARRARCANFVISRIRYYAFAFFVFAYLIALSKRDCKYCANVIFVVSLFVVLFVVVFIFRRFVVRVVRVVRCVVCAKHANVVRVSKNSYK